MLKKFAAVALCLLISFPIFGQQKAISFKKLQLFLPQGEITGFTRNKPTGTSQTITGMSMSEAAVTYSTKESDTPNDTIVPIRIKIQIQDASYMPYVLMQFAVLQQGYESENENGYEKAIKVKDTYLGKLSVRTGDDKSCKNEFGVANKFFVQIEIQGTDDTKLLDKVISMMDLDGLSKVQDDK